MDENSKERTRTNNDDKVPMKRRLLLRMLGAGTGVGVASLGGIAGSAAATTGTIDNFEDNDLSEYSILRGTANTVSSPVYTGDYSLEVIGDTEVQSTASTKLSYPEPGDTFSCWVRTAQSTGKTNLNYGVQNHDNRYVARVNFGTNELKLFRRYNGTGADFLGQQIASIDLVKNTWYELEVTWGSGGSHTATLYDSVGTQLAQVSGSDTTWSTGGVGYDGYFDSELYKAYFDYVKYKGWEAPPTGSLVVDDFNDGDLTEYSVQRGTTETVSTPVYDGSYALKCTGDTDMVSMSGLAMYPSAGDIFTCRVRSEQSTGKTNFSYGVQNHNNRYVVRANFDTNELKLFRRYDDGSLVNFLGQQTASADLIQDAWYQMEVNWGSDGTHIATLYDDQGTQLAQVSGNDSTWTAGGIGYGAHFNSSGYSAYFDYVTLDSGRDILEHNQIIDGFEDNDLSEYSFKNGNSSEINVVNRPTWSGSSVLEISNKTEELISTSGLDYYPSAGDVFSCWVQGTDNPNTIDFTYGVQNMENKYQIWLDFDLDEFKIFRRENGTLIELAQDISISVVQNKWYNIEVDWRKHGLHIATLYDSEGNEVTQIEATDTTWTEGGIGYGAYQEVGGTMYFNSVVKHYSVVDDFEHGNLTEYSGDTASFGVQSSTVIERSQSLEGINPQSAISHTSVKTPRSYEYSTTIMAESGSGGKIAFMTSIQDPSAPLQNCYYLEADSVNNTLSLYRQDNGSSILLDEEVVTINENEEYTLIIGLEREFIIGSIEDSSGTLLASIGKHDVTHLGGYLGFYLVDGPSGYFDSVVKKNTLGEILDNFEDGNIHEYSGETAAYIIQSSTVLKGNSSLKCEVSQSAIAHKTAKTPREAEYRCHIRAENGSNSKPGLLTCVQDPSSPLNDCYWVEVDPVNDVLSLIRRDSGISTILDQVSVTINEGQEYQLGVELFEDSIRAALYNEYGKLSKNTGIIQDTVYTTGTVGLYTGGTGTPTYYDFIGRYPFGTWLNAEVSTSSTVAQTALESTVAQEVIKELNNPSADTSNSTRVNSFISNSGEDLYGVKIPIDYGELLVLYHNGSPDVAQASLNRTTMPDSLISDLSGDFGWPTTLEQGMVTYDNEDTEPTFRRSATDSEKRDVTNLINDTELRTDDPIHVIISNKSTGGFYNAHYYNQFYNVNAGITEILRQEHILEHKTPSPRCISYSIVCVNAKIGFLGLQASECLLSLYACLRLVKRGKILCGLTAIAGCRNISFPQVYACRKARQYCPLSQRRV